METAKKICITLLALALWVAAALLLAVAVYGFVDITADKTSQPVFNKEQMTAQNIQIKAISPDDIDLYSDYNFYQLTMDVTNTGCRSITLDSYTFALKTADEETRLWAREREEANTFMMKKTLPVSCSAPVSMYVYSYDDVSGKMINVSFSGYPDDQLLGAILAP